MQDSLLSLHIMTACDTTSVLQPSKKYNMQTFQRMSCKRCICLQYNPGYHIGSQQILSSATFVWCPIFHLTGCIQTLCIYTCHGEKVCQRLLQTIHTIPQLVLQLVGHLPHQPPLLKLVSCKCKTGCSQCCGCRCAPNSSESVALL